eukprot:g34307.t1
MKRCWWAVAAFSLPDGFLYTAERGLHAINDVAQNFTDMMFLPPIISFSFCWLPCLGPCACLVAWVGAAFFFRVFLSVRPLSSCGPCWCINSKEACPSWEPRTNFSQAEIDSWKQQRPVEGVLRLQCDPFQNAACTTIPPQATADLKNTNAVCGFIFKNSSCKEYTIHTFSSADAAQAAGAVVTHIGACGVCSTAQDFALYTGFEFDLTREGKNCAVKALLGKADKALKCFLDLGFTEPCARIWTYNAIYTADVCKTECLENIDEPNNGSPPECTLNECLQCDEDKSGPIFMPFAGRTRRRSGLRTEEARPCEHVARLVHQACPTQHSTGQTGNSQGTGLLQTSTSGEEENSQIGDTTKTSLFISGQRENNEVGDTSTSLLSSEPSGPVPQLAGQSGDRFVRRSKNGKGHVTVALLQPDQGGPLQPVSLLATEDEIH